MCEISEAYEGTAVRSSCFASQQTPYNNMVPQSICKPRGIKAIQPFLSLSCLYFPRCPYIRRCCTFLSPANAIHGLLFLARAPHTCLGRALLPSVSLTWTLFSSVKVTPRPPRAPNPRVLTPIPELPTSGTSPGCAHRDIL